MFECPLCGKEFSSKVDILEHWDIELAATVEGIERRCKKEYWDKKKKEAEDRLTKL